MVHLSPQKNAMGTQLRRIQVSIPDSLMEALADWADAEQKPISKVIVLMLSEMEPQIRDFAKYARSIKAGKMDEAKQVIAHMLGNSMAELIMEEKQEKQRKS
jgi:hypothetical protein